MTHLREPNDVSESQIEKETFWQKSNPYRGSWKYWRENLRKKPKRAYTQLMALMAAPWGIPYATNQKEVSEDQRKSLTKVGIPLEISKAIIEIGAIGLYFLIRYS